MAQPQPRPVPSQRSSSADADSLDKKNEKDYYAPIVPATAGEIGASGDDADADALLEEEAEERPLPPLRYRLVAFSMIILFVTGSNYAEGVLSPLKPLLRKKLKITSESAYMLRLISRCAVRHSIEREFACQLHTAYPRRNRDGLLGRDIVSPAVRNDY